MAEPHCSACGGGKTLLLLSLPTKKHEKLKKIDKKKTYKCFFTSTVNKHMPLPPPPP